MINAVQARDIDNSHDAIADIIKNVADSQAAMFRGFTISGCQSTPVYTDYLTMIGQSMNAVHAIVDIGKSNAVSSTAIKRSTRSFNRMINSMIDMMEERDGETFTAKPKTQLEQARLQFIKDSATSLQSVITAVSTNAQAKIPESFSSIMASQATQLDAAINALKQSSASLTTANTNKQAAEDFTNELNDMITSFNTFQKVVSQDSVPLEDITQQLITFSDAMQKTLSSADRLSDEVQRIPDFASAEQIPQRFTMPSVPDTSNTTITQAYPQMEQSINEYLQNETAFYQIVAHPQATNAHFVQFIIPLNKSMENLVLSLLRVSATTLSINYQQKLTASASSLVDSFDSLLRSLKDKFLLRGDFDTVSKKVYEDIHTTVDNARQTATTANEQSASSSPTDSIKTENIVELMSTLSESCVMIWSSLESIS